MTKQEKIKTKIDELKGQMNDLSVDFIANYDLEDINNVDDALYQFADEQVSDCYYEQFDFYNENQELCDNVINDIYGDFADFAKSYDDAYNCMCGAGFEGWQASNLQELKSDKEVIITCLYLYNLLDFKEVETLNDEEFSHFLSTLDDVKAFDFYDFEYCDTFEELAELLGLELC